MPQNLINIIQVNPKQPTLIPQEKSATFEVDVSNDSNDYADIQLRLNVKFESSKPTEDWYRLSPEVSSLIPPGTWTQFSIEIFDTPEFGFVGETNIIVEAFSTAEPTKGDRRGINVDVKPASRLQPLKLKLFSPDIKQAPNAEFRISVEVENPNQQTINANLKLLGLDISWIENNISILELKRGEEKQQDFFLKLPNVNETVSQEYPFTVEATHINSNPSIVKGLLTITPEGSLELNIEPEKTQEITAKPAWKFWRSDDVNYQLILENKSNVSETVTIAEINNDKKHECNFTVTPVSTELKPRERKDDVELKVNSVRHWFGKPYKIERVVQAIWSNTENLKVIDQQEIEIIIKPIIPYWLQIGGLGLLLCLFWWILFKPPTKHAKAVNSVQFNGVGETIISGSDDQSIINWRVSGFNAFKFWANPKIRQLGYQDKSVRRVRIRPVDNNLVAVALENGEMQIWDLLSNSKIPKYCFSKEKDDRVFALEFSNNSRYLFSGHGNKFIHTWDLQNSPNCSGSQTSTKKNSSNKNSATAQVKFGIESLKFVGENNRNLAIAGRYNQLIIWNLQDNSIKKVNYPNPGGQNDYITSLATAEFNPNLLVTSDYQGYITVFDIKDCLEGNNPTCGVKIDGWDNVNTEKAKAVNSVALTANACYLASGTQDGKVMFWPLTKEGNRDVKFNSGNGKEIDHGGAISSVDIKAVGNDVLVVSGSADSWVRLKREKRLFDLGCDRNEN